MRRNISLKQNGYATSRDAARDYVAWAEDSWLLFTMPIHTNYLTRNRRQEVDFLVSDERGRMRYLNLYFEISRFCSVMGQQIQRMSKLIGYERVLFGSGAPFKEITPALLKLQHAALSSKEKNAVAWQNIARILRIS